MAQLTDFGVSARVALIQKGKNQEWLAKEVSKETGLFCDKSYLSKIFHGSRSPDKIENAVRKILEI